MLLSIFFYLFGSHQHLNSFPTRRSSDLGCIRGSGSVHRSICHSPRAVPPALSFATIVACHEPRLRPEFPGRRRRSHPGGGDRDRKSTRLNSSHLGISYAVFCLKKKK